MFSCSASKVRISTSLSSGKQVQENCNINQSKPKLSLSHFGVCLFYTWVNTYYYAGQNWPEIQLHKCQMPYNDKTKIIIKKNQEQSILIYTVAAIVEDNIYLIQGRWWIYLSNVTCQAIKSESLLHRGLKQQCRWT